MNIELKIQTTRKSYTLPKERPHADVIVYRVILGVIFLATWIGAAALVPDAVDALGACTGLWR